MAVITPDWFNRLDLRDPDDVRLRNKFFVRTAALLQNPHGNLKELADAMGISLVSLTHAYSPSRGRISPRLAIQLENIVGADKLPVKLILPESFF